MWLRILFLCIGVIIFNLIIPTSICGQNVYFKSYGGFFIIRGDLTPKPVDLSFGPGNWAWGFSAGYGLSKFLNIHLLYMNGSISGNDALSDNYEKRSRNLSFKSPLIEYGTYSEIRINHFWKGLDKYKLRLNASAGLNLITFNPQTIYDQKWVYLQPLGTEGQTLPSGDQQAYKLSNWSRALGLSVEFDFSKKIALGIEVNARKTWTDYLDDVSTQYPDREAMITAGNILGAKLSDRSGEFLGTGVPKNAPNTPRGRSDKNDWYSFFGMYLKLTFGPS